MVWRRGFLPAPKADVLEQIPIGSGTGQLVANAKRAFVVAMLLEAALVLVAPLLLLRGTQRSGPLSMVICLCIALGIQNGVFSKSRGVSLHTSYVTGNLTTWVGQLTRTLRLRSDDKATPRDSKAIEMLSFAWVPFVVGAFVAAAGTKLFGAHAVWFLEVPLLTAVIVGAANEV